MKILFILFFPFLLTASSYPYYTQSDFAKLEMNSGKIAKNRAMDYQKKVNLAKKYDKNKQINFVNNYLNQLLPQYDDIIQEKEDYWSTPKEFLSTGYGDCEDYVIIKYFTLIKLGFSEEKLYITTVHELYSGGFHMVLSYFKDKNKPPLILDNLSFRVLALDKRTDLKGDTFTNSHGVFKIDKNYNLIKIANHSREYIKLLKKVKSNR